MITFHELEEEQYDVDRFDLLKTVEGEEFLPYIDTPQKLIPTIGIGFNLRSNMPAVANEILGSHLKPELLSLLITDLITEVNKSYVYGKKGNNPILINNLNSVLQSWHDEYDDDIKTSFAFENDTQMINVLNAIASEYENKINKKLSSIPPSSEKSVLFSLAYNTPDNSSVNLIGPNLINAINYNNRAEAWYEIRYQSNKDKENANRRYLEAEHFGLYSTNTGTLPEDEAMQVAQMYVKHRVTILQYEAKYTPKKASENWGVHIPDIGDKLNLAIDTLIKTLNDPKSGHYVGGEYNDIQIADKNTPNLKGDGAKYDTAYNDFLMGDDNANTLDGGIGNNLLIGGGGNDLLTVSNSSSKADDYRAYLYGGEGNDSLTFSNSSGNARAAVYGAYLYGEVGDDTLTVSTISLSNIRYEYGYTLLLYGGEGNDSLTISDSGGQATANLYGEAGDDTLTISTISSDYSRYGYYLSGGDGNDTLQGSTKSPINKNYYDRPSYYFDGGNGDDFLQADYGSLMGGDGNDTLQGNGYFEGGNGDDTLQGGISTYFILGNYNAVTHSYKEGGNDTVIIDDNTYSVVIGISSGDKIDLSDFNITRIFGSGGKYDAPKEYAIKYPTNDIYLIAPHVELFYRDPNYYDIKYTIASTDSYWGIYHNGIIGGLSITGLKNQVITQNHDFFII